MNICFEKNGAARYRESRFLMRYGAIFLFKRTLMKELLIRRSFHPSNDGFWTVIFAFVN